MRLKPKPFQAAQKCSPLLPNVDKGDSDIAFQAARKCSPLLRSKPPHAAKKRVRWISLPSG